MPEKSQRILFCTPPLKKSTKSFDAFNEGGSVFPSIGVLILASIAREHGHEVLFKDFGNTGREIRDAVGDVMSFKPDYVGISSNTDMIFQAAGLASEIKTIEKNITVLIGGPHVSAVPLETMEYCRDFDIGFLGEAETSFPEVINSSLDPALLKRVKGICFREGKSIVVNERQPFIPNLDSLPFPAWDLIEDIGLYKPALTNFKRQPVFSLMTSRGCFGQCIFCDREVFGNSVRMHSADYVIKMIQHLWDKYGIREITFYDDTMVFNKKRLKEICTRMIDIKKPLSWSCGARVDLVDEDTLRMMKNAGCWQISFGIESGSQKILSAIKKGITIDRIKKTADLMKKIGISMRGYFIVGNPGETKETLEETRKLMLSLPMDDILVEYMTPYPGTELYRKIKDYGTALGDWATLNSYDLNFIPYGLEKGILKESFFRLYKAFYLRPRIILNYARRLKSPFKITDLGIKYLRFAMTQK